MPSCSSSSTALGVEISSFFLMNKLGARDTQRLAALSLNAGATGVSHLASVGNSGKSHKNNARDIKRLALRGCVVPKPYMVQIPIKDNKQNQMVTVDHPVLLPHEVLECLVTNGTARVEDMSDLSARVDQTLADKKKEFSAKFGLDDKVTIPLGFHGDGVPFQKSTHKHASTEVYSWNLLCDKGGKRYMFCNINKDFLCDCGCAGRCTLDILMQVFVWSMHALLDGQHPHERHDHEPLDDARKAKKGTPLGFHAVLLQVRGDWQWYMLFFGFPAWNSGRLCWRCKATQTGRHSWRSCGPNAPWRRSRYKNGEFMAELMKKT